MPEAFPIANTLTTACDDEANPAQQDGLYAFDTATFQNTILGTQTGIQITYFDQNNITLPSPLPNPFVTTSQNVKVVVTNPVNTSCTATYTIPFVVHKVPIIALTGNEIVCNEKTLLKNIDAGLLDGSANTDYTYIWKRNGIVLPENTYSITVNQAGTYTVTVTNVNNCSRTRTIEVIASDLATFTNIKVTDLTQTNSIFVTVSGAGDYVYSLDGINFQTQNSFEYIASGVYTVFVKDLNGCGIASEEVSVLGIPSFFTPNGDGYHDHWNIKGLNQFVTTNTKIYIFDRFGKLLKQLNPASEGWDGSYQNQPMPADDYWYVIKLNNGREIKGNFTLKR